MDGVCIGRPAVEHSIHGMPVETGQREHTQQSRTQSNLAAIDYLPHGDALTLMAYGELHGADADHLITGRAAALHSQGMCYVLQWGR